MLRLFVSLVASFCLMLTGASHVGADVVSIGNGEDTSPYSFLPNLARYNNASLYAFETVDSDTGVPHDFETYVWFDVDASDIPVGQVLDEAFIVVTYAFDFTGFGETSTAPATLDCRQVLEDWDQTTLTWANRPLVDAPFDTITGIVEFGSVICDATPLVAGWVHGYIPNHGIALSSPTERVMGLYSFEAAVDASLKPTLFLTTEVPEPAMAMSLGVGCLAIRCFGHRRGRRGGRKPRADVAR